MIDGRRLIEDYLPIQAISAEASREKSVRKGHISTLHLGWARRPLVACRAAVYGALVPASHFVPNGGSDAQKKSSGRANAAKFIERLCKYPGSPDALPQVAPATMQPGQMWEHAGAPTTSPSYATSAVGTPGNGQTAQSADVRTKVPLPVTATRNQIFKAFPAIANLADKSDDGEITVQVEGTSAKGVDTACLRNAVEEPLDEADVKGLDNSQ